jgi:hypothetical protein
MMVYIGASKPLLPVPWNENHPAFHVGEVVQEFRQVVQAQLGTPTVLYAGSYEGCGCGFQYGDEDPEFPAEEDQLEQKQESLIAFSSYLRAALHEVGEVRVLACWAGDEDSEPSHHRQLTPADLLRDDFYFLEGELSVFRPED